MRETEPWTAAELETTLKRLCDELGEKPRTVYLPIRVAVTGSRVSPGLYESLELLGKETSLERLRAGEGMGYMSAVVDLVGVELGPTSWFDVTQERIDAFAAATDDAQWIHTDPERAAVGPFGSTIAHGFLTLSLCVPMLYEVLPATDGMVVNYGVNKVRFPAPVRVGSRIRGRFEIVGVEDAAMGVRVTIAATVECDGTDKPVCVAELVTLAVS